MTTTTTAPATIKEIQHNGQWFYEVMGQLFHTYGLAQRAALATMKANAARSIK